MQVGQNRFGMQTMTQALVALTQRNLISNDEALAHATEPEEVRQLLGQPRTAYAGTSRAAG
jgi:twitching motility protein PilT